MGNSSQISAPELKTSCKVCMAPGFESPLPGEGSGLCTPRKVTSVDDSRSVHIIG